MSEVVQESGHFLQKLQASLNLLAAEAAWNRFASFWGTLFASTAEAATYGRALAAMFLVAGVHGMPPIHGTDPVEFMQKFNEAHGGKDWGSKVKLVMAQLPANYGSDISDRVYKEALARARNPKLAIETIQHLFDTLWKGDGKHIKPEPYASAIAYLKKGIHNSLKNVWEKQKRDVSIDDEERGPELVAPTSPDLHKYHAILEREIKDPKVRAELSKIDPDAVRFVELILQGHTSEKEIVGDPKRGVPSMLPTYKKTFENWMAFVKPKIYKVLMEHFETAKHASYDYDRSPLGGVSPA